ncbi:conserved hypothetical protein [Trichinella spiralis]|uniref:hypothetical protein n=1 Tax=Trichinella spiralis TaxID=6334 RepID=UPI0001EFD7A4|nr:conserved hypothetical protein [Trichinella spiralis]
MDGNVSSVHRFLFTLCHGEKSWEPLFGFVQKESDSNYRQRHLATVAWRQPTPNSFFPSHLKPGQRSSDKLLKIVLYQYHYGAMHPLAQPPVAAGLCKLRYV